MKESDIMLEFFKRWAEWDMQLCYKRGLKRAIRKVNSHAYDVNDTEYNRWLEIAQTYAVKCGVKSITVKRRA